MRRLPVTFLMTVGLMSAQPLSAFAQGTPSPTPGPTNPTQAQPSNPQAQPGATMVVNPTTEECRKGWNASLKWTKQQFEEFCSKLQASK